MESGRSHARHPEDPELKKPLLRPALDGKVLIFIDSNGQIQWPHLGTIAATRAASSPISMRVMLERIDYQNYGFAEKSEKHTAFQVLSVETIEKTPRILLAVVFNWHPNNVNDANRWWYEVQKMAGDEQPVIVLSHHNRAI